MSKPKKTGRKPVAGSSKGKGSGQVKKSRGPKSHLEPSKIAVDENTIQGAEEMLDEESEDDEGEEQIKRAANGSKGKNTDFLLKLDEKGVSK